MNGESTSTKLRSSPSAWQRRGLALTAVGAGLQVAGLGMDAWLHLRDPFLATREGPLTLSNPGHALVAAGFTLVVLGVLAALAGPRLYAGPATLRTRVLRIAAPMGLLALVITGAVAATSAGLHEPHDHPAVAGGGEAETVVEAGHGGHDDVPDVPLDPATERRLLAELETARLLVARYPTVADAEAAGYRMTSSGPGAHYTNWSLMDGVFDTAQPEQLVAEDSRPDAAIIGLSYYVVGDRPPAGFAGPNDRWHRHEDMCFRGRELVAEAKAAWQCRAVGGELAPRWDGWMLHVWVVPGWENPLGVFSAEMPFRLVTRDLVAERLED